MSDTDIQTEVDYIDQIDQACRDNDMDAVKLMIDSNQVSEIIHTTYVIPGLLEAARNGNMEIFEYLCTKFRIDDMDAHRLRKKTMSDLSKLPETLDVLIYFIDKFKATPQEFRVLLARACRWTNLGLIRYLCDELDLALKDFTDKPLWKSPVTPLDFFCLKGDLEIVEYLTNRFSITMSDIAQLKYEPFYSACEAYNLDLIRYFCESIPKDHDEKYYLADSCRLVLGLCHELKVDIIVCICETFVLDISGIRYAFRNYSFKFCFENCRELIRNLFEEIDESSRLTKEDAQEMRDIFNTTRVYYDDFEYWNEAITYLDCYLVPKVKNATNA